MKRICIFERRTPARNAFNEEVGAWAPIATAYADFVSPKGAELFTALQSQSKVSAQVECRYTATLATVTPKDRIRCDDKIFDIEAVIDPAMRHRRLLFMVADHSTA